MFVLLVAVVLDALLVQHDLSAEESGAAMSGWLPPARPATFTPTQLSSAKTGIPPVPGMAYQLPQLATPRAQAPAMIAVRDVFQDGSGAKPMANVQMPGGAGQLLAAAAGAAGFVLTPSRRPLVRAAGGALLAKLTQSVGGKLGGGGGGSGARSRPAVAALLADADSLKTVDPEAVDALRKKFRVSKEEFSQTLEEMYVAFFEAAMESSEVETTELSELIQLQEVFDLTPIAVGRAVYETARRLQSRYRAYWESDEPSDTKAVRDKFVFLAERVLSQDESPEGYRYEALRLQKLLGVSAADWSSTAAEVASPFYARALKSVLEGKATSPDRLAQIRDALGLPEEVAQALHADALAQKLEEVGDATDPAIQELEDLFESSPDQVRAALMAHSGPQYTQTLKDLATRVGEDGVRGELDAKRKELRIEAADATDLEVRAFQGHAADVLAEGIGALRAGSTDSALSKAKELVTFRREASALTGQVLNADVANAAKTEVLLMYRTQVTAFLKDGKIDASEQTTLQELRDALKLSVADATSVYEQVAGPLAKAAMQKAANLGEDVSKTLEDLGLPPALRTKLAVEVYIEHLQSVAGSGEITEEQSAGLAKVREALGVALTDPVVQAAQDEVVTPGYAKAVKDAFSTGAITEASLDGLLRLRERLGLSEAQADEVYALEVRGTLKTLTMPAMEVLQKAQDEDGKLGIDVGSVVTEVKKAMEFAENACVFGEGPDGKEVAATNLIPDQDFPRNALKAIYRQTLIEGFSASNSELLAKAGRLALLLGLDTYEANEINIEVGSNIIRQYLATQLPNGPVGEKEREFLKSVQDALDLKPEKVDELIEDCQRGQVLRLLDIFGDVGSTPDADDVRSLRDEAERFEVDLAEDLDMSKPEMERLFMYELEDFVDNGEGEGDLEDAAKQLHVSEARAQELLEELVQKRVNNCVLQAWIANKDGNTAGATGELQRVVKLASLAPCKAHVAAVSQSALSDLNLLYQLAGPTAEQTALLAEVLGMDAAKSAA